ncbi:GTP-binding protein [Paraburkholderia sp. WC7.3b]|uniref:GTP-binding protein n=2 Tax=Burkholderiaceae TaxID=119060 RepID=A0ABR7Q0V8_9BURK|nr:GTP-binding protein [Paraburkholderia podalyriae]
MPIPSHNNTHGRIAGLAAAIPSHPKGLSNRAAPSLLETRNQLGRTERLFRVCAVQRRRFPAGASPARQPLQPEATGAVMEGTKWLKPSDIRSFDLNAIIDIEPDFLADLAHEHDDDVTSFVYRTKVPLDRDKVEEFFSEMVATYGPAMLRYKGVLDIHGVDRRTVFQGVHMMFGASTDKPWGGVDERETKIVFIGKQLPADLFRSGLDNCMIREDLRQ